MPPVTTELADESAGMPLQLKWSSHSATGYAGVCYVPRCKSKPYEARAYRNRVKVNLGYHATAVGAATAVAKYKLACHNQDGDKRSANGPSVDPNRQRKRPMAAVLTEVVSDVISDHDRCHEEEDLAEAAIQVHAETVSQSDSEKERGMEYAGVQTEVGGVQLHLSSRSVTGYKNVTYVPRCKAKKFAAQGYTTCGHKLVKVGLGHHTTAVEAAVAVAKFYQDHRYRPPVG